MIFEGVLGFIKYLVLSIIGLLPEFPSMGAWVNASITPLLDVIISANYFINLGVCAGCLVTVIIFSNIDFVWSGIMWIIRKIPGVN